MTPDMPRFVRAHIIPAALALLPSRMDTIEARAFLLAIALHESECKARRQHRNGPARGLWQFEREGAVRGVLTHDATESYALSVLQQLQYPIPSDAGILERFVHNTIEHNDILAAALARLNLWWHHAPCPHIGDTDGAYAMYLDTWRPGRERPEAWPPNYERAWEITAALPH